MIRKITDAFKTRLLGQQGEHRVTEVGMKPGSLANIKGAKDVLSDKHQSRVMVQGTASEHLAPIPDEIAHEIELPSYDRYGKDMFKNVESVEVPADVAELENKLKTVGSRLHQPRGITEEDIDHLIIYCGLDPKDNNIRKLVYCSMNIYNESVTAQLTSILGEHFKE